MARVSEKCTYAIDPCRFVTMQGEMRSQPVQNVRYPVFPLDRIQQLCAPYCEYQRMTGVLERRRDAIVDAHLHSAIVGTGTIETKQQALNEESIISINGIVHLLTYCSPFRQFAW